MTPRETELFEAELGQLQPNKLPRDLAERLVAARPSLDPPPHPSPTLAPRPARRSGLLRWLAPALGTALGLAAFLVWRLHIPHNRPPASRETAVDDRPSNMAALPRLQADDVEIDRQLVAAFDAVATLPTGEPVRFRCRQWNEEIVLRDSVRGVVVEQHTPRFEVVPVRFETY